MDDWQMKRGSGVVFTHTDPAIFGGAGRHFLRKAGIFPLGWAKAHGLRKNAVNALMEAGCIVAETASISGQTLQMIEHYAKMWDQKKLALKALETKEEKAGERQASEPRRSMPQKSV